MIEFVNSNTVRLTPDKRPSGFRKFSESGRSQRQPRRARLNAMERKLVSMAADALGTAMDEQLWLRRQIRRADDYQAALEAAGCVKGKGLPGYVCPSNAKVLLTPGEAKRWARK